MTLPLTRDDLALDMELVTLPLLRGLALEMETSTLPLPWDLALETPTHKPEGKSLTNPAVRTLWRSNRPGCQGD